MTEIKKLFPAMAIVLLLTNCNPAKKASKTAAAADSATSSANVKENSAGAVLSSLNQINFTTFSGRVDVDFDDGKGNGKSVSAKLEMKKDEVIWISAGLMGFEGVRALITPDSVKILNKLQKEYTATSLSYIQDKIGLPLDFKMLQELLIGNAVFVNKENASLTKEGGNYIISTQDKNFKNVLTVLMSGNLPTVSQLSDVDTSQNRSARLQYDGYQSISGRNFSTMRNISVQNKDNITIRLNFKSYDFDGQVTAPFSVPPGYKTKN